ncbi:MAG TPA: AAA family ATPase, partial [Thermodesulfovibrionia bacterium]|nr:AAA family ATPase [Thermodesulfovibrionia bacterium]
MKILSLRFRNLNSLKGEFFIPFNEPPLSEVGIFAITGPTGGGKTTILDALSLGLYGETPRLKNPAEHIITKHTGDAFSEVMFAVKDTVYRATWSAKRARKLGQGKVQTPKMELHE